MLQKLILVIISLSISLLSHASNTSIKVSVQAKSKEVAALGFTVNGKDHGGMGKKYSKSGMPLGASYQFGVRVGSIFGKSVSCGTAKLTKNSMVSLNYDGRTCSLRVTPLK